MSAPKYWNSKEYLKYCADRVLGQKVVEVPGLECAEGIRGSLSICLGTIHVCGPFFAPKGYWELYIEGSLKYWSLVKERLRLVESVLLPRVVA